jgi:hypothetical protein
VKQDITTNERPFAAAPPEGPGNARERLAFNYGPGTVPGRRAIDAAIAAGPEQTFATAAYAEPRDWGYAGLLAFTAVLLARPQDLIPALEPLHLAEVCAIIGIAPMILHRIAHRQPVFRITPETLGIAFFGLVIVATAPFSIWPGGDWSVHRFVPEGGDRLRPDAEHAHDAETPRASHVAHPAVLRLHRHPRGVRLRPRRAPG